MYLQSLDNSKIISSMLAVILKRLLNDGPESIKEIIRIHFSWPEAL